eukprot:TRINITY_DN11086_c0_g1_i1.p1 TRINITY_DN11086_c0_g1~~TRINITY_DN11086_c0_g1_i1.p1  ORF type:complete len:268 (+),score=97.59 TRINITY_DN11086_c0_g1_i1:34-837(+)
MSESEAGLVKLVEGEDAEEDEEEEEDEEDADPFAMKAKRLLAATTATPSTSNTTNESSTQQQQHKTTEVVNTEPVDEELNLRQATTSAQGKVEEGEENELDDDEEEEEEEDIFALAKAAKAKNSAAAITPTTTTPTTTAHSLSNQPENKYAVSSEHAPTTATEAKSSEAPILARSSTTLQKSATQQVSKREQYLRENNIKLYNSTGKAVSQTFQEINKRIQQATVAAPIISATADIAQHVRASNEELRMITSQLKSLQSFTLTPGSC